MVEREQAQRVGLLATNSIRTGANRRVLDRIKNTGDIFMAWADREWILDGAAVRVSMVGFDKGQEMNRLLDGKLVTKIFANLTASVDVTNAEVLLENANLCFLGMMKGGPFDITADTAVTLLKAPLNPNEGRTRFLGEGCTCAQNRWVKICARDAPI